MQRRLYFPCFALLLTIVFFGCQTRTNYVAKVSLFKITEDNMYKVDDIKDYLFDAEELNVDSLKNRSRQLFLHGIDLYKNQKNAEVAAVSFFRRSILVFPDAKAYYELGCALTDAGFKNQGSEKEDELKEALKSLEMANNLNFEPKAMIYYQLACAQNLLEGIDTSLDEQNDNMMGWSACISDLNEAFLDGFSDTTMLKKDGRINDVLSTKQYKRMLLSITALKADSKHQGLFDLYKKAFPQIQQPFAVGAEQVEMKDYKQSISYDFAKFIPEMENTEFGRSVSNDYFYVGRLAETPLYTALLYTSISFMGEEMQPVYTKLVTYTPEGKIIDSRIFACQASAEKIKTGRIENNEITLEDLKRNWKYPYDKTREDSNKVSGYESIAKATFMLNDSGRIVPKSVPANYKDSSVAVSNPIKK